MTDILKLKLKSPKKLQKVEIMTKSPNYIKKIEIMTDILS